MEIRKMAPDETDLNDMDEIARTQINTAKADIRNHGFSKAKQLVEDDKWSRDAVRIAMEELKEEL